MDGRPLAGVIRLTALGDVLLATPLAAALSKDHDVVFVTSPAYAPLVARCEGVTGVVALDRAGGIGAATKIGKDLKTRGIRTIFDLQNKLRSRAVAWASGARVVALQRRTTAQAIGALFGRDTVLDDVHQVSRELALVGATPRGLGRLTLDSAWIDAATRLRNIDQHCIAIAPAATHATKSWGPANFAALVQQRFPTEPLLLVAGPNDAADVAVFRNALGNREILDTSTLPLTTLAALLSHARVLVGNDSGPVHLATMLGVPTVAVFGPTSVTRWGPVPGGSGKHAVARLPIACAPCSNHGGAKCPLGHHRCLRELTVEAVAREVDAVS